MDNKINEYNKEQIFKEQILPCLQKIEQVCVAEHIPFFFTIATANTPEKTTYENYGRGAASMGLALTKDNLVSHMKVCSGFEVFVPDTVPDLELTAENN